MTGLLSGELKLTLDIIAGLIIGELVIRSGLAEKILCHMAPCLQKKGVKPIIILSLTVSLGSSKTGAAILASALRDEQITRSEAIWSVLMLPLPSYLKRWPATFALSVSMAGAAGGIFASFLLIRSIARFFIAFLALQRSTDFHNASAVSGAPFDTCKDMLKPDKNILLRAFRTLPMAWLFFAIAYSIVPALNDYVRTAFLNNRFFSFIPFSGYAVAAGSISHVSAALALAGGSLKAGELNTVQAVFALILGSGLGVTTRILRQNAGYYFGLFPNEIAGKMLFWNFATILPLVLLSLFFAGLALLFQ